MPRYLLSVHGPAGHTEPDTQELMLQASADTSAFTEKLRKHGHVVVAGDPEPAMTAAVDGQGEKPTVTDGPSLEAQECLDGFWVIEAADLDVALALAAEGSSACRGTVEVRPIRTEEPVRALPEP